MKASAFAENCLNLCDPGRERHRRDNGPGETAGKIEVARPWSAA